MEQTIVIEREKRETERELYKAITNLQAQVKGLKDVQELTFPTTLQQVNAEKISEAIARRTQLVREDASLTESEKSERLGKWDSIKLKACRHATIIANILAAYPEALWKYDPSQDNYYCTNTEYIVTTRCTHEVPDEAIKHRKLVAECISTIVKLREWERKQNIKTFNLERLAGLTDDEFADIWISGSIKCDTKWQHLGIIQAPAKGLVI